jgi:plastocyanin
MSRHLGRSPKRVVALFGAALIIAAAVLLVGHERQGAETAQSGSAPRVDRVRITGFAYAPAAITVPTGTTVTFTNSDSAPHTATSGTSPTPDGMFDSGTLRKGDSKRVTLTTPGRRAYYCALHPFMKATVIVERRAR